MNSVIMNALKRTDRLPGWERRVLERAKSDISRGVIVDATPRTRVVGKVKVVNLRPTIRALVEKRARELMAQRLIALSELSKRGLLDKSAPAPTTRLVEPALM